jgi:hypothetical protein
MEIRPLLPSDGPAVHRTLLGDPEIAAWFRSSGPFTLVECEEMVTRKVAHRSAHRFGWSVSSLGLHSVVAYTREDNAASCGVMDKLGMTYEKSFGFHGEAHVLYRKPLNGVGA